MLSAKRRLQQFYGPREDLVSATEICAAARIPTYVLGYRCDHGQFPRPDYDFGRLKPRAWRLATIWKTDPDLARQIIRDRQTEGLPANDEEAP